MLRNGSRRPRPLEPYRSVAQRIHLAIGLGHAAQVIALEDLNLAAMAKSMGRRAFRRSVADVGLGELQQPRLNTKTRWPAVR